MSERIKIEKAHAGYILRAYPQRSLNLTAQDLRDISDWCQEHMSELEEETVRFHVKAHTYHHGAANYSVCDREIKVTVGPMRGEDHVESWHSEREAANQHAATLNRTRGHASDEPKCVECGAQPAGGDPPRCASCHSKLERD